MLSKASRDNHLETPDRLSGTGKTTVTAASAHLASRYLPIVLVDADVDAANLYWSPVPRSPLCPSGRRPFGFPTPCASSPLWPWLQDGLSPGWIGSASSIGSSPLSLLSRSGLGCHRSPCSAPASVRQLPLAPVSLSLILAQSRTEAT